VHANRTIQHLKDLNLLRIMDRRVTIPDLAQLQHYAEFDEAYLALWPALPMLERRVAAV
jgi:hypothetical protein